MRNFKVSGIVEGWRIETMIYASSINHSIKIFQGMYKNAKNVYCLDT